MPIRPYLVLTPQSDPPVSASLLRWSLKTDPQAPFSNWQDDPIFEALSPGIYYWAMQIKETGQIKAQGSYIVLATAETPFVQTYTGTVITIPQSEHSRSIVRSVLVIDTATNWTFINNVNIDPATQLVTIDLGTELTVKVIIS